MKNIKAVLLTIVTLFAVSCSKSEEKGKENDSFISVYPASVEFGKDGGTKEVVVISSGAWSSTLSAGADWLAVEVSKDKLILTAQANESEARTASVEVKLTGEAKNATLSISQAKGEPKQPEGPVYQNDFDKEAAQKSGSSWPSLKSSEAWKNHSGSGAANVTYEYSEKMTVRSNVPSDGSESVYEGSGVNNIFFGTDGYFTVRNIAVSSRNLTLSFGAVKYTTGGDATFQHGEFQVAISDNGTRWCELDYTFEHGDQNGKWDKASVTFTLPANVNNLSVRFKPSVASLYRLDDLSLSVSDKAGSEIDFSGGQTGGQNPGTGTGDGTAESPYDVTRAKSIISAGQYTNSNVYVKGVVSHVADIAATEVSTFGNATYYISNDGGVDGHLYVYHGYGLDGAAFAKMEDLRVGMKVTICGKLTNYNGLYEITSDSKIVAIDDKDAPIPTPAAAASAKWLELPATKSDDGMYFVSHDMKVGSTPTRNYSYYYDKDARLASWVAYPLSTWNIGSSSRTDAWGYDPKMPASWQPSLMKAFADGTTARGDRGHQIPSADRYSSYAANLQTFYYTNMTPQLNAFNGSIWGNTEAKVRNWTNSSDTLYVVTGCLYKDSKDNNLDNYGRKVTVPTGYFKTVLRKSGSDYSAIAIYFDHKKYDRKNPTKEDIMSIDDLENKTGIDFYVNLESVVGKAKADEIEAQDPKTVSWWGIN